MLLERLKGVLVARAAAPVNLEDGTTATPEGDAFRPNELGLDNAILKLIRIRIFHAPD